jgi:hypothetical protein
MQRTITLQEIFKTETWCIRFADKEFGAESLEELFAFSESELAEISGRLLRSLLVIEYMRQQRLPISATLDATNTQGQIVTING